MPSPITLTTLANVMRVFPDGKIVPEEVDWKKVQLFRYLQQRINRRAFRGKNIEIKMKTRRGAVSQGSAENTDLPRGVTPSWETQLVPIRWVQANAEVTAEAQILGQGPGTWDDMFQVVADALDDLYAQFYYLCNQAGFGNGTGAIARVVSASHAGTTLTVTCDNVYTDRAIENVQGLLVGQRITIYRSGSALGTSTTDVTVTAVTPGYRTASGSYAASTGTFTFEVAADPTLADNDEVYLAGSKDILPMGLQGIIQDGTTAYSGVGAVTTFQNLARSGRPGLRSKIYEAEDFGPSSESPADGTPCSWELSNITDMILQAKLDSGLDVDLLAMHPYIAMAIDRLNNYRISINVDSTNDLLQSAIGEQIARNFIGPEGRLIPILSTDRMPRHMIHGVAMEALQWHPAQDFDFRRLYGTEWQPVMGERLANFEAPFWGGYQISSNRCDGHFTALDLRHDV